MTEIDTSREAVERVIASLNEHDPQDMEIIAPMLRGLLDEIERMRGLLDFAIEMTGEPDCWYDHHGYCQAHNLQPKGECWVELAKKGADQ